MKFNKLAQLARESEEIASSGDAELVDVPAVDIGEALAGDAETLVTEIQADVIEGDQEIIEATSSVLDGTDGIKGAPDDMAAAAETIRVLGKRYGVSTLRVTKESIANGVGISSLRKDAAKVKKQVALAKEAVDNRFLSSIKNFGKKVAGQFSMSDKRFDALLSKAQSMGESKANPEASFDNGQVLDSITINGALVSGSVLKKTGGAFSAIVNANDNAFKTMANAINTKNQNVKVDLGSVFPAALRSDGKVMLTADTFAGGVKGYLTGFEGKASNVREVLDLMSNVGYQTEKAPKVAAGSKGQPALDAKEVAKRIVELRAFSDKFMADFEKVCGNWINTDVNKQGKTTLLWWGMLFLPTAPIVAIASLIVDNKGNNSPLEQLGGYTAKQANKAIGNFASTMYMGFNIVETAWYGLCTNLLHYYDWCLKNQATAPATESLDEGGEDQQEAVVVDPTPSADAEPEPAVIDTDVTQENGETGGLVDTLVQADLNTVQDVEEAATTADEVTEDEAAEVEETLNAVAERRGVQRVRIAREGYDTKRIKANVVAAAKLVGKNLQAKKAKTAIAGKPKAKAK